MPRVRVRELILAFGERVFRVETVASRRRTRYVCHPRCWGSTPVIGDSGRGCELDALMRFIHIYIYIIIKEASSISASSQRHFRGELVHGQYLLTRWLWIHVDHQHHHYYYLYHHQYQLQ